MELVCCATQQCCRSSFCCGVQVDYWRGQLAGAPCTRLPTEPPLRRACSGAPPAAGGCMRGGWLAMELPQETVVALEGFAARCGATLFMVLLAALQLLLGTLCGQDDVVVRPRKPLEFLWSYPEPSSWCCWRRCSCCSARCAAMTTSWCDPGNPKL